MSQLPLCQRAMDELQEIGRLGSDGPQGADSHARFATVHVLGQEMSGIDTTDALNRIEEDEFSGWDMVQNLESQSNEHYEPSIGPQTSYGWKLGERLENHEKVVNDASLSLQPTAPEFLWERQDSWLGQVFGKRDISSVELVIGPEPKYSRVDPPLFEKPVQQQTDAPLYFLRSSRQVSHPNHTTCLLFQRIQVERRTTNAWICTANGQNSLL